jgi:hypothetical protein
MTRTRIERVQDYLKDVKAARLAFADISVPSRDFDREVQIHVARELERGDDKEYDAPVDPTSPRERFYNAKTYSEWVEARAAWKKQSWNTPISHAVVTPETDANGDRGADKGWMGTSTGRKFWPLAPKASDVALADIARGLSMTCRYGGQVKFFYSVAEHCVIVSRHVPAELALKALFHDCAEAYVGDMIRPLKHQAEMSEFRRAEAAIEKAVFEKLGLVVTSEEHAVIKEIDDRILIDEITALSARPDFYLDTPLLRGRKPLGASIVGFMPPLAEDTFCLRYRQITGHAL